MKVWLSLPFLGAPGLIELTRAAARAGVTGVSLSDHLCVPARFTSPYPYSDGGEAALPPETPLPDPLVAIAGLAGHVPDIRFMTGVLIAPLRHPIILAKEAATAAALSGGRLDLGLGSGWLEEEFVALGHDSFAERGRVTTEMISIMRQLWSGSPVAHRGRHFEFDAVAVNPVPPEPIPVFLGGHSDAALRRCARLADGWVGANPTIEELRSIVRRLNVSRDAYGDAGRPFEIRTGIKGAVTPERVEALHEIGVDALLLAPWQIGERRASVFDQPASVIADALPDAVAAVMAV